MAWNIKAITEDGRTHSVAEAATIEEVRGKVDQILQEGFDIESKESYIYFPARVIIRVEAKLK